MILQLPGQVTHGAEEVPLWKFYSNLENPQEINNELFELKSAAWFLLFSAACVLLLPIIYFISFNFYPAFPVLKAMLKGSKDN